NRSSWRMFRRSGRRFADKNMRKRKNRERVPIPKERNMLSSSILIHRGKAPAGTRLPDRGAAVGFAQSLCGREPVMRIIGAGLVGLVALWPNMGAAAPQAKP